MGQGQSTSKTAVTCKIQKVQLKDYIAVIQDAHNILQFYASALLLPKIPRNLPGYKSYSNLSEAVFNSRRNEPIATLSALNLDITTLYEAYIFIRDLKSSFERIEDENGRRAKLDEVFKITYGVLDVLTTELSNNVSKCALSD